MKYKFTSALGVAILSMFMLVTVTAAGEDAEIGKGTRTFNRVQGVYQDRVYSANRRASSDYYQQVEMFFDVAKRPSFDSKRDFNTRRFVDVNFVDSKRDFNTRRFVDVDFVDSKRDFNTRRFVDVNFVDSKRDFNTRRFVDVDFVDSKRDFNTRRRGNRPASFSFSTNCRADF